MVEIFFNLVDKIIEMLMLKKQKKEKVFREIIEPLFKEMPLIVNDYFTLFNEAEESYRQWMESNFKRKVKEPFLILVTSSSNELKDIIDKIKNRRQELLHTRIKIREMADLILQEFDDVLITDFAEKIHQFFYSWKVDIPIRGHGGTDSQVIVDFFELLEESKLKGSEFLYSIRELRINHEQSWSEVTRAYALLRIRYFSSKRKVFRKRNQLKK
jgi:hypothetical protein